MAFRESVAVKSPFSKSPSRGFKMTAPAVEEVGNLLKFDSTRLGRFHTAAATSGDASGTIEPLRDFAKAVKQKLPLDYFLVERSAGGKTDVSVAALSRARFLESVAADFKAGFLAHEAAGAKGQVRLKKTAELANHLRQNFENFFVAKSWTKEYSNRRSLNAARFLVEHHNTLAAVMGGDMQRFLGLEVRRWIKA